MTLTGELFGLFSPAMFPNSIFLLSKVNQFLLLTLMAYWAKISTTICCETLTGAVIAATWACVQTGRAPGQAWKRHTGFIATWIWASQLCSNIQRAEQYRAESLENGDTGLNNSALPCFRGFHRHLSTLWNKATPGAHYHLAMSPREPSLGLKHCLPLFPFLLRLHFGCNIT